MKVVIPSEGNTLSSQASQFFGRCPYFIVAELEDGKVKGWEAFSNPALGQAGGAGIMAAQFAAEHGAEAVIASAVGPKAEAALGSLGIKIFRGVQGTVQDNIGKLIANELEEAAIAAAPRPFGRGPGFGAGRRFGPGAGRGRGAP
jgi:predicted Fe-Mo cluster-binding NifX family protein